MKLKQRVIMMSSMFLTMVLLFLIGTHLSWPKAPREDQTKSSNDQQSESSPATITTHKIINNPLPPGVPEFVLERFKGQRSPGDVMDEFLQREKNSVLEGKAPSFRGRFPLSDNAVIPERVDPWKIWKQWVKPDYFYPMDAFYSDEMNNILETMATAPVTEFGLGYKGTQLKTTMMLETQRTVFKPRRYSRDEVIGGPPYSGFDRHNGEIAGFHLDGILGFRLAPPVVGRRINLTSLQTVTTDKLRATYFLKDGNTCFYGVCYYCRREEAACADGDVMEGSVTLWLPDWYTLKTKRHPYQRTYRTGYAAKWEKNSNYCKKMVLPSSSDFYGGVLEYTDTAVYDFLMGNADRHHYEVYAKSEKHGRMIHIDNGKTFGNPGHDEMSILAPLMQCCRLRSTTWDKLQSLEHSNEGTLSEILDKSLQRDPIYPILSKDHLAAIDRRLLKVLAAVRQCIDSEGEHSVIVDSWG